ncbi:uncharacterized protein METZ01_LOCUS431277, partial [marine metagenome]
VFSDIEELNIKPPFNCTFAFLLIRFQTGDLNGVPPYLFQSINEFSMATADVKPGDCSGAVEKGAESEIIKTFQVQVFQTLFKRACDIQQFVSP